MFGLCNGRKTVLTIYPKIFWRKNTSKEHYESGEMGGEASGVQSKKSKNDRSAA